MCLFGVGIPIELIAGYRKVVAVTGYIVSVGIDVIVAWPRLCLGQTDFNLIEPFMSGLDCWLTCSRTISGDEKRFTRW